VIPKEDSEYAHRQNADGRFDSICVFCHLTVSSAQSESESKACEHHPSEFNLEARGGRSSKGSFIDFLELSPEELERLGFPTMARLARLPCRLKSRSCMSDAAA